MTEAEKVILEIVKEVSKIHPEGEKFFDHLDELLINDVPDVVMRELFSRVNPSKHFLVISGGFGKRVSEGIDNGTFPRFPYVLYKGGIRKGAEPEVIKTTRPLLFDNKVGIFLDDSIYGGATYRAIQKAMGPILQQCLVIYDGCPVVREDIKSIFRYYDHYEATPNFEF